jgi:hypothetical protein
VDSSQSVYDPKKPSLTHKLLCRFKRQRVALGDSKTSNDGLNRAHSNGSIEMLVAATEVDDRGDAESQRAVAPALFSFPVRWSTGTKQRSSSGAMQVGLYQDEVTAQGRKSVVKEGKGSISVVSDGPEENELHDDGEVTTVSGRLPLDDGNPVDGRWKAKLQLMLVRM